MTAVPGPLDVPPADPSSFDGSTSDGGRGSRIFDVLARRCPAILACGATALAGAVGVVGFVAHLVFDAGMTADDIGWWPSLIAVWVAMVVGVAGLLTMLGAFAGAVAGLASRRRRADRRLAAWLLLLVAASPAGALAVFTLVTRLADAV